jgi:predicted dehydrogenase
MTGASGTEQHDPLRLAVLGLGRMGRHHLAALRERSDVEIVAVGDHGSRSARDVAAELAAGTGRECHVVTRTAEVVGLADAAIVAVPTAAHADVASTLLVGGVACLVEKPIAASAAEAERMIAAADAGRAVLQIGHIERFNPAFVALCDHLGDELADGSVRWIAAQRTSRADGRTFDVDAVLDLMIHDLDLLEYVTGPRHTGTALDVYALEPTATFERASAWLERGRDGDSVELSVELVTDRAAAEAVRTFTVESPTWLLRADLDARTLKRRPSSGGGAVEEVPVPASDPLRAQLDAFLRAVRGRGPVAVDGAAGLAALRLAERIRATLGLAGER